LQAKGERTSEAILEAARHCFADRGYHRTSIKAIASRAGIRSPSILHYHFDSKAALFREVMGAAVHDLAEHTRLAARQAERGRPLAALDALWRRLDERPELPRLLVELSAAALRDDELREELLRLGDLVRHTVEEALRELLGEHAERMPIGLGVLSTTLLHVIEGHAVLLAHRGADGEVREAREGLRTMLGLLRPSQAAPQDAIPATKSPAALGIPGDNGS
jgi:AcrR family transcriptional regulator